MGKVKKGVTCNVKGCDRQAVRSVTAQSVVTAGFEVTATRRAYLCEEHSKAFKKKVKKERLLERWRWKPT